MTNTLKATLKGTAFAFTLFSFIGCTNDNNNAATVSLTGSSIAGKTMTATPVVGVVGTDANRTVSATLSNGTTVAYYLPIGSAVIANTATNFYTIAANSTLFSGTIKDSKAVKVSVNGGADTVDLNLMSSTLTFPSTVALPTGTYTITLPNVTINKSLEVGSFVIKNIIVDSTGASNFIKSIVSDSTLPMIGAVITNANVGLVLDTLSVGKKVSLTIISGDKTHTKTSIVDGNGVVNFNLDDKTDTLSTVKSLTLDLNVF